jgi:hypothetical protein
LRSRSGAPLRIEAGVAPDAAATRIALYVQGFSIVFISVAGRIPDADWDAVRQRAAVVVQRPNFGLDFGAW